MAAQSFDLIVIGAGPGGYVAAIRGAQLGMKVAIIERENLGGICLNWGCIPTKALLRTAEVYHLMKNADQFGLSAKEISFDIKKIVERSRAVAKQLSGGIAILRVGAATESELIERYDRVDDALHATRAALEEGVLPGGGIALYRLAQDLGDHDISKHDKSFISGYRLLIEACLTPFRQILDNAGLSHHKVLNELKETEAGFGYDVRNKKFGDMFELGVLDPAKVSR